MGFYHFWDFATLVKWILHNGGPLRVIFLPSVCSADDRRCPNLNLVNIKHAQYLWPESLVRRESRAGEQKASWAKMEAQQTGVWSRVWPLLDFWLFESQNSACWRRENVHLVQKQTVLFVVVSSRCWKQFYGLNPSGRLDDLRGCASPVTIFFFFYKFTLVQTLRLGYWTICACVRGEHLADCSYSTTGRYNKDRLHQGKR